MNKSVNLKKGQRYAFFEESNQFYIPVLSESVKVDGEHGCSGSQSMHHDQGDPNILPPSSTAPAYLPGPDSHRLRLVLHEITVKFHIETLMVRLNL